MSIKITLATTRDKKYLEDFFKHYQNQKLIKSRVEAFLNFGQTIIAKDAKQIIGLIQWQIKEDPNLGVVELEEVHVLASYQRQGIGSKLINQAIIKNFYYIRK